MSFFQISDNINKTKDVYSIPINVVKLLNLPLITVAIPTYKRNVLLKDAIESVVNQTYNGDFEIIVVDNDPIRKCETELLMLNYHDRVSYYKNERNLGMFGNWNRCISIAKGEYLTILNDDDLLDHNYIKKAIELLNLFNNKPDVLLSKTISFRNVSEISAKQQKQGKNGFSQISPFDLFSNNINPGSLGVLFNTKSLRLTGGYNEEFYPSSDYFLWLSFFYLEMKILKSNQILSYYRMLENESFNAYVQETNIQYNKLLRLSLVDFLPKFSRSFAFLALPVYDYQHALSVNDYCRKYNIDYSSQFLHLKKRIKFFNRLSFIVFRIISKAYKIVSKIRLLTTNIKQNAEEV